MYVVIVSHWPIAFASNVGSYIDFTLPEVFQHIIIPKVQSQGIPAILQLGISCLHITHLSIWSKTWSTLVKQMQKQKQVKKPKLIEFEHT